MGFSRGFCFFIVTEQIIIGNIQIVQTISNFTSRDFELTKSNAIEWAHMSSTFVQILVAVILAQGLLERKIGKFLPWLITSAFECVVSTAATIVVLCGPESALVSQITNIIGSKAIVYTIMILISVFYWAIWITVLLYYRHLKIKGNECKLTAEKVEKGENDTNPQETVFMHSSKNQHNMNENTNLLYPVPTAPEFDL